MTYKDIYIFLSSYRMFDYLLVVRQSAHLARTSSAFPANSKSSSPLN